MINCFNFTRCRENREGATLAQKADWKEPKARAGNHAETQQAASSRLTGVFRYLIYFSWCSSVSQHKGHFQSVSLLSIHPALFVGKLDHTVLSHTFQTLLLLVHIWQKVRCKEVEGSFYHMSWTCKVAEDFGEMIYNELKNVFKVTFPKRAEAFFTSDNWSRWSCAPQKTDKSISLRNYDSTDIIRTKNGMMRWYLPKKNGSWN